MDTLWVVAAIAGVLALLVVVDRLTAAGLFDRRGERPRERRPGGGPLGDAFGGLHDVFDPSHRHLTEEQNRERSTSVQVPGEAPPLIDLDSGLAVLPPREPPTPGATDEDASPGAGTPPHPGSASEADAPERPR